MGGGEFMQDLATEVRDLKWGVLDTDRSKTHFGRKFYHMAMGLACFCLYAFILNKEQALFLLVILGGSFILLDVLRFKNSKINAMAIKVFGKIMRREELKNLSANSYYILGLLIITLFFPKNIVLLSVLFLAFGDPVAAIIGTKFGQTKLFAKKSLEGSIANFFISAMITFAFVNLYFHKDVFTAFAVSILGGLISCVSELLPIPVNDNLTIPVVSALLLKLASGMFKLFY
jgi:dolichol kinase